MRHLVFALLVALFPALLACGIEPQALMKTMDGFRKEVPPAQTLSEMNGFTLKDMDGKDFTMSHLAGVARRLEVKTKAECLVLLTYLKDPDPKIRFIAAHAIENVVRPYPGGMSLNDIVNTDSDGHRELSRRFTEKVAHAEPAAPEPGPENGGLRLRLVVAPPPDDSGKHGFRVRFELLNVSERAVTLRAGWLNEDKGDLKDYVEASASIETYPPIAPWVGGVRAGSRLSPQPEHTLKTGEVLSVGWQAAGRRLKNNVTDPGAVQNPGVVRPGLYSVHADLIVITGDRTLVLRSNEQLVPVGGSRETPKHTYGQLLGVAADAKTATLGLGSFHKVERGDQFRIQCGKVDFWRLTITEVSPESSKGRLEFEPWRDAELIAARRTPRVPERLVDHATLIPPK